jgi:hypothetical protein
VQLLRRFGDFIGQLARVTFRAGFMNEGALLRPSQGKELIPAKIIPKAIRLKNFANARNWKQISSFPRE